MPYPNTIPEAKHDIVSPNTISISSGILKPFFQSTQEIIQQIKSTKNIKLQKLVFKTYTYHDVPSTPKKPSKVLYFAGFCKLSSVYTKRNDHNNNSGTDDDLEFDHESFIPYDGMTVCHIATKRADKSSLSQQDLDNSNKFMLLCNNLRLNDMVVLIQCPKTNRAGFFIPMKETEDGSNFSAYWYVGEIDVVEQMLVHVENGDDMNGGGGRKCLEENMNNEEDEPVWKPDEDDNNQLKDSNTIGMEDGNDTNDMWQPPGSTNDTNHNNGNDDDNNMWKPPGGDNGNNNDDDGGNNLWQPPGSNNTDDYNKNNDDESNLWDQPQEQSENSWNQQPTETATNVNNGDMKNVTLTSQDNNFHADSGAAAADKFYSELTRSLGTRADSILYHMRNFNGWVKATQIAELDPVTMITDGSNGGNKGSKKRKRTRHPLRILDLACGKGGDLGKVRF